jgi:hypothetical protein
MKCSFCRPEPLGCISVDNIGDDTISLAAIFSAPGFEELMREGFVREGEKNVPVSKVEEDEIEKKHSHAVIYEQSWIYSIPSEEKAGTTALTPRCYAVLDRAARDCQRATANSEAIHRDATSRSSGST